MSRAARRLLFVVLWLVLADCFVPSILQRAEHARYEGSVPFRFENSDLFALGPMVRYLREHPHGERRRAMFLGNSIVFGYGIPARDAVPAQFEALTGNTRVFNAAINGQELGDSYLVGKSVIDSVDTLFVQLIDREGARPLLGTLIPIDDDDARRFHVERRSAVETTLRSLLGRVWRLYAANDRLQAALFGTSTRQYLYLHKKELLTGRAPEASPATASNAPPVALSAPRNGSGPLPRTLLDLAAVAKARRKRLVVLDFQSKGNAAAVAEFNVAYAPYAEIVTIVVPDALEYDRMHFTAAGAHAVAAALVAHEAVH
jgi:hypothetical protein